MEQIKSRIDGIADYSTINLEKWQKLPEYHKPPTYEISYSFGSACSGDPPGFPSYFVQHVYTQYGNGPRQGATMLLFGRILERANREYDERRAHLRRLYVPLPYDHPRTRAWIAYEYQHGANCYFHPTEQEYGRRKVVIRDLDFEHTEFTDDARFSDTWREAERARLAAYNAEMDRLWFEIALPQNYMPVVRVREWYPEHPAVIEWPDAPSGNWYEIMAERPTPENCPGEARRHCFPTTNNEHSVNGTWCQVCGWNKEPKEQEAK